MSPRTYHHPETDEITLARVLAALSDPTRLEMIRRLADGGEHDSLELADDLPRSTLTYHTRMLRDAGVTWTRSEGRACLIRLRSEDLDQLFPGVLAAVIANAGTKAGRA
ncbi:transcriptional regulator [Corynebacterium hadale]|uniref:Transcriptional regulator n=2 Tax=Corynebacterium TaxID=1716 RepID=A0A269PAE4_9CORY|nr:MULTISPECIES: helix-turn-helix domain-containing protein [Corynebacterium]PAJ68355.1 transcriptional regulator [Corynebacterium hadale]PAT03247.1 transcriptional regulator [Corynebacterium sp. NML 150383]PAT05512.1 transcriptional regulator [Corynebacterium hadale]PAT08132.1 transcriptional regulator [Corynebacterium hadale]PAT11093.1 transcriptional regulator [Corynebacterium hadale]